MPSLTKRSTVKVVLATATKMNDGEECWVECFQDPIVGDVMIADPNDKVGVSVGILTKLIKAWNFNDESGSILPITAENVRLLPITDMALITDAVGLEEKLSARKIDLAKKNS